MSEYELGFAERVRLSGVPLDKTIVIGSGVLDALGLRKANDVDLLITTDAFDKLASDDAWEQGVLQSGSRYLRKPGYEVWDDWANDGDGHPDYDDLLDGSVVVDGIRYVSPEYLLMRKKERGETKDIEDIKLLENYLKG